MITAPLQNSLQSLRIASGVDSLSSLHRITPLPKVIFALGFLVLTVSFDRYDWRGVLLFALFPLLLARIGKLRLRWILNRCAAAIPFVLCAGIANCFFDRTPVPLFPGFEISGGIVSLIVLVLKTLSTVGMVLVLTATTGINGISGALYQLHVPCILILQIQLLFRYLVVVMEEAQSLLTAYFLRNPDCRIIPLRSWGPLTGNLFLRTVLRSEQIYKSMQCRLFRAGHPLSSGETAGRGEWMILIPLLGLLMLLRYYL